MPEINEIVSKKAIDGIITTDSAITKLDESTMAFVKTVEKLSAELKKGDISFKEVSKAQKEVEKTSKNLTKLEKEQEAAIKSLERQRQRGLAAMAKQEAKERELERAIKREVKSEQDLIDKQKALILKRKQLDKTTEEGTKEYKKLTDEINKNTKALKESDKEIGVHNRNVGDYKNQVSEALAEQEVFGTSLGKLKSVFSSTTGIIGAGVAILAGLTKAYISSARGAEDLARANDRLNSITKSLGNSIADSVGEEGLFDKVLGGLQVQLFGVANTMKSNVEVAILSSIRKLEIFEQEQERQKKSTVR